MTISYSKNFIKQAKKCSLPVRKKIQEAVILFLENPLHPKLRNHALKGKYRLYRSINVTPDVRIVYIQREEEVIFDTVGTHSQLYG